MPAPNGCRRLRRGECADAAPVSIGRVRGQAIESESGALRITVHPSYLLRLPHETPRQREFVRVVKDLVGAKGWLASHRKRAI